MLIKRIPAGLRYILNLMKRLPFLIKRSFSYIKAQGLRAYWRRVKERISREIVQRIYKPSPDLFEGLYSSFINTARNQKNTEYVPIAEGKFPIQLVPVKLIAFYLPQFHPIPENDEWWGKGFTEWTNVSKAMPQFVGHYQPHLPGELGFYDLRVPEIQKRQIELARKYGVYGFAFYYYWFNGKRLLEKPIDLFFSDKENKFPFCIFWANENWTRRWDGKDEDILIGQDHSPESDLAFISDIDVFLRDERYIRIDGKPVLLVYRVQLLPNPKETAKRWREYCREMGIGEIYLIAGQVYGFDDPLEVGFDAVIEFPPHNLQIERINDSIQLLNPAYQGHIYNYQDFANFYAQKQKNHPYELFKTVSPGWDNEPRKPGRGSTFAYSTPHAYQQWLKKACFSTLEKKRNKRFVFINAWNEWGEGAYLEPDRYFGYAYLQATRNVLNDLIKVPILIFQMSKVGSTSVTDTLSKLNLSVPIFDVHILNKLDVLHENILRRNANARDSLSVIKQGRIVRKKIESGEYASWNIISMVRDPVARNMSAFFQQIKDNTPDISRKIEADSISAEELLELFLQKHAHNGADWWFDTQLKPVFDFDIFARPFNKEQGYEIYEEPRFRLLMMRLENMNAVIQPAMSRFLDIQNFTISKLNVGKEKKYGRAYSGFLNLPLPLSYIEEMYSTRTAIHFYTKEELERFTRYWTKK